MYFDIFDMNMDGTIQREEFSSVIHHLLGSNIRSNYPIYSLVLTLLLTQVVQRARIALTSIDYLRRLTRLTIAPASIAKSLLSFTRR